MSMATPASPASGAAFVAEVIDNGTVSLQQLLVVALCLFFNMLDGFDITAMAIVASPVATACVAFEPSSLQEAAPATRIGSTPVASTPPKVVSALGSSDPVTARTATKSNSPLAVKKLKAKTS